MVEIFEEAGLAHATHSFVVAQTFQDYFLSNIFFAFLNVLDDPSRTYSFQLVIGMI